MRKKKKKKPIMFVTCFLLTNKKLNGDSMFSISLKKDDRGRSIESLSRNWIHIEPPKLVARSIERV